MVKFFICYALAVILLMAACAVAIENQWPIAALVLWVLWWVALSILPLVGVAARREENPRGAS
jgi:hypothetical protein